MPTTDEDIQHLVKIVKIDLEVRERARLLGTAPRELRTLEKKIRDMDREFKESRKELEGLEHERRGLEVDVEDSEQKINQKRKELISVKSNKEYRALNSEIEYLSNLVDKAESRILVILEEMEAKRREVEVITGKINQEKDELLAEIERLKKEIITNDERLKVLKDEKSRIMPHLSEKVQRLYERILKVKGDSGVANLVGDICQGCYSRVPPQKAHEIRKNDRILTCEACGRIIVYFPVE